MPSQSEQDRISPPTGLRSGAQYLAQICDDGRQVIYDGEVVKDVGSHPAFRGAARSIAGLWDIAADPKNRDLMAYKSPGPENQCSAATISANAAGPRSEAPHDTTLD